MKSKAIVPLAIGLIVGIFAVSRGLNYIKSVKGTTVATVPVVAAKAEIPQGVLITDHWLTVKQIPKDLAPARHFSKAEEVFERVTTMVIPQDMPVMPTMLAPKGTAPGLGAKIPDGMRAVAVKVDEWSAVGGWIKPGVRVDVSAVFSVKDGRKSKTISKIILQNIEVAAVGGTLGTKPQETGANVSRSVTLIVKPKDVSKIHLASQKGKISLAMRGSLDDDKAQVDIEDEDDLFGYARAGSGKQGSVLAGLFKGLFSKQPEPVQLAQAQQRCLVDLVNGGCRERRVYQHARSMELVGSEGTKYALLSGRPTQYVQHARRAGDWGTATDASDDPEASDGE